MEEPKVWKVECFNWYGREVAYVLAKNARTAERVALGSFPVSKRQYGEPKIKAPAKLVRGG